jgi:hypothetical protein
MYLTQMLHRLVRQSPEALARMMSWSGYSRPKTHHSAGKLRTGAGGAGYRPMRAFQYAHDRASIIPGGAWSSASLTSSSVTNWRSTFMSSWVARANAYAMNRTGSASASPAGSNHTRRVAW